jgi:AraC-like DNA-binding protein
MVANQLVNLLPSAESRAATVWQRLNMSTRSFTRQLAEEGTTFGEILERLRRRLASRYVADDHMSVHNPANTAVAEQSLQAPIAIAESQKAQLRTAHCAVSRKLYRAANRDVDAYAVLAPAPCRCGNRTKDGAATGIFIAAALSQGIAICALLLGRSL